MRSDRQRGVPDIGERIAVRLGGSHPRYAERAAGAGNIDDNNLHTQEGLDRVCKQPTCDVDTASGRRRHDHLYRAGREFFLGNTSSRCSRCKGRERDDGEKCFVVADCMVIGHFSLPRIDRC